MAIEKIFIEMDLTTLCVMLRKYLFYGGNSKFITLDWQFIGYYISLAFFLNFQ